MGSGTAVQNEHEAGSDAPVAEQDSSEPPSEESARYRLLPVPVFITEPAVGEGLGVALALFHPVKAGKRSELQVDTPESLLDRTSGRQAPPVVTGLMGAYTNNETWFAGLGHINNWRNDSIRYAGILAAARINSQVYPAGLPVNFTMETEFTMQEINFRLGNSDFMLGGGIEWADAENRFGVEIGGDATDITFNTEFTNVGLYLNSLYDSRDSSTNPLSGKLLELSVKRFDEGFGGDFDFWRWSIKALSFHPLGERLVLGLRLDVAGIDGRPPFVSFPYVQLRGIPAMRYQGEVAGAVEGELRYQLAPRWQLSAFTGMGQTSDSGSPFSDQNSLYNWGIGCRFKVLQAHDIWMGIDVARGPEEWNGYIQVGQAW